MKYSIYLLVLWCTVLPSATHAETEQACVILLHGLIRNAGSMGKIESALQAANYHVVNLGYPSREHDIETLAEQHLPGMIEQCLNNEPIHFVTHSMGGILVRQYLSLHPLPGLGKVVMLSPPNQGSEVVDHLGWLPPIQWLNGPAGQQLGTDPESIPKRLPDADFDLGIITGDASINLFLSWLIPGADDGKVSVASAQLEGARDFLVMPYSHPFIMKRTAVIEQILYYLEHGQFHQ